MVFRRIVWVTVGCLIGGLLASVGGLVGVDLYTRARLADIVTSLLPQSESQSITLGHVFGELNSLTSPPCSEEGLAAMRALVFRNSFIRDVAYIENRRLICSSGLGTMVHSLPPLRAADFVTASGRSIRRNIELKYAPGVRSTSVDDGRYDILVTPIVYPDYLYSGSIRVSVILTNRKSGATLTISGPALHLDISLLENHRVFVKADTLISVACVSPGNSCIVLSANRASLFLESWSILLLAVIVGAASGGLSMVSMLRMRSRAASLPVQLRRAIRKSEFFLHYQPIFDANTGRVVSAEALIRWTLPNGSSVSPATFIPEAERIGVVNEITRIILREGARDLYELFQRHPTFSVSFNISSLDLTDPRFLEALDKHVVGKGIRPAQIALELTERSSVESAIEIEATHHLHAQGYQIYVDDFGMGYSNISYLNTLSIQKIKLDKSFTDEVCRNSVRGRLVPPILAMAAELGLAVIVEGVEDEDQMLYFRKRGISLMQGWFFAPAMPIEQLSVLLDNADTPFGLAVDPDQA
jgi:sensor c-di-GMP phosphodiesterase-like protein